MTAVRDSGIVTRYGWGHQEVRHVTRRTAIVTGANSGVGFETTLGLARAGVAVVLACRNLQKARVARDEIQGLVPAADLTVMELDLSDLSSVRSFASSFRSRFEALNLLVNNAGVLDYSGRSNGAGIELQLATNHLGHFLLTSLLIGKMPDEATSRVVSLSSVAHKSARIVFEDINCERHDRGTFAYGQSKLACLIFSSELQRRLVAADREILSVCAHPGGTDSGLFDDASRLLYYAFKIVSPLITHSNGDAAKPSLHAALSPTVRGGDYYGPQGFRELKGPVGHASRTPHSEDTEVAERLWIVSEELVGERFLDLQPPT